MKLSEAAVSKLADPASTRSLSSHARARRWEVFAATFPAIGEMHVVDLGGRPEYWVNAPVRPAHVTLLNPRAEELHGALEWMTVETGDACDPELDLTGYDLCHANSVIEHVGGAHRRGEFAANVSRAPRYWVQTPYRYFPIEPHFLFPGFQLLPLRAKAWVSDHWPLAQTSANGIEASLETELVTRTEMRYLFPGSRLYCERLLGLIKSITALKTESEPDPVAAAPSVG
jgi:hypothetical protein